MRSLYISLTLFTILIICIIINVGFIHRCADTLQEYSSRTPDAEAICELEDFWERNKEYIGLSISETHLDNVERLIVSIRCAYEAEDENELTKNLALLSDAAEGLRRYERLSAENIF